jgi:hypothetical protein
VTGLPEAQFEPDSNEEVLKNKLGIKSKQAMDEAEATALERAMDQLVRIYDENQLDKNYKPMEKVFSEIIEHTLDIKGARVQIEMLRQSAPNHLLAFMLEHQIAEHGGKKDSAARAYKAFLAAYDAEMATGRKEYQDHQGSIERFRAAAQAGMTGKK